MTGQSISLSLTLPDMSSAASETATGLVSTGAVSSGNANIAIIYDASGSTFGGFSGEIVVGDANGDGSNNTILDAEFVAIRALIESLNNNGFGGTNIGLISFGSGAATDFTGTAGQDADANGIPDVIDEAADPTQGGGTNFERPLQEAIAFFNSAAASGTGENIVFFLSDGFGSGGFSDEVQTLIDPEGINAEIRAFGVGNGASEAQLDLLDDGINNDSATIVLDPSQLQVQITGSGIDPASIINIELFVNGVLNSTIAGSSLVSTPFGLQYTDTVNLDTTADDVVVAQVNVDQDGDGTSDFSLQTSQVIEQDGQIDDCVEIVATAPSETFAFTEGKLQITNFDFNEKGGERTSDTLEINVAGFDLSINTTRELLDFVKLIETDGNGETDAVYSDDNLALILSRNEDGSVNEAVALMGVIGRDGITLEALKKHRADEFNKFPDREDDAFCDFGPPVDDMAII